jgi:hypothetical protein
LREWPRGRENGKSQRGSRVSSWNSCRLFPRESQKDVGRRFWKSAEETAKRIHKRMSAVTGRDVNPRCCKRPSAPSFSSPSRLTPIFISLEIRCCTSGRATGLFILSLSLSLSLTLPVPPSCLCVATFPSNIQIYMCKSADYALRASVPLLILPGAEATRAAL